MAEKRYRVLAGKAYTGKHRVYKSDETFPESELFGDDSSIALATKGQAKKTEKRMDERGNESNAIVNRKIDPVIEVVTSQKKAK